MENFIGNGEFLKNESFFMELCQDVINLAANGVFLASVDGKLKKVNQIGCDMFGYTQKEMADLFVTDLIQADDLRKNPLHLEKLQVGNIDTAERRLKRKDGSEFVAEIQGQKLPGGLILGILRNVTEQKAIRETMHTVEDRYRKIFETANEGIWGTDEKDITIFVNTKMTDMLGYSTEEMIGKPSEYFIFPEDLVDHSKHNQTRQSGISERYERRFRKKDGSILWAMISAAPDMDEQGVFQGSIAMLTDITDQKLTEAALRENEEKYRLLHEYAGVGIGYYTPQGIIISYNEIAAKNIGGKPEDFTGKSNYEIFPKAAADVYLNRIKTAVRSKSPQRYEDQIDVPAGIKWFDSTYTAIKNASGEVIGVQILSLDITERKLAEEALRESEERYRLLYQRSPLGYQSLDADGNFLEVNDAWLGTLGYSREEVIGHWFGEFLPPPMVVAFRERFPKFKADGEVHNQFQMVRKDGKTITVAFDGKIGHDRAGHFKQTHCVLRDITEQQKLQDALRESEERYRTVADYANDWETWIDPEGKYKYCSPSCEQITGYPPEKFIEAPEFILSLVHPDDREIVEEHFALDKTDRQESTIIYRIHRNDGQVRWIEHNCRSVFSKDGSFLGVRGNDRDVTNRKLAEKALYESEERYRRLTDHAPDIIFRYDLSPTMKLVYINPAIQTITGYSPEECTADPALMLNMVHPDDRDQMNAMLQDLNVPEEGFTLRWIGKDGVTRWMESRIVPMRDEAGQLLAVEGITRDLTDRIKMQEDLARSESLYRSLVENASNGVLIVQDGVYQYANPAALKLLDRDASEIPGLPIAETIHPESLAIMKKRSEKVFVEGAPNPPTAMKIIRPDGKVIISESTSVPVSFGGKPAAMVIGQDVTDRIHAENALETSEHFLDRAQKIARLGNWTFDLLTSGRTWSDGLYEIYGFEKQENDNVLELWLKTVHPDDKQFTIDLEEKFLAGESDYDIEYRIIRHDNQDVRIIHATAELIRNDKGVPIQVVGVAQDITERKREEEETASAKAKLEAALESMTDAVFISDINGKFVNFNEAFATFHKFKGKDEMFETLEEYPAFIEVYLPDGELATLDQWAVSRALRGETVINAEYTLRRKDTGETWIGSYNFAPILNNIGVIVGSVVTARDITKQKKAEDALKESELRFRTLFEHAAVGVALIETATGRYIDINQKYCDFLGYTKTEMLHSSFQNVTFPADRYENIEKSKLLLSGQIREFSMEKRYVRKDSTIVWGELTASPLWAPGDTPSVYLHIAIVVDITERKQAEKALLESERVLASAQKIAHLGSWDWNVVTHEAYWSDEMFSIYGREKEDGPPPVDVWQEEVHPEDREYLNRHIEDALAGKSSYDVEYRIFRRDNHEERVLHAIGEVICDENGTPTRLTGAVQDITDTKRAQETLRNSELDLRKAQKVANLGSWTWHIPTNQLEWSDQMYHIFGIDKTEFSGDLSEVIARSIHPDDRAAVNASNLAVIEQGKPAPLEYRVVLPDGTQRVVWGEAGELTLDEEGKPLVLTGIVQDITEYKQAEALLRESEEKFRYVFEASNVGKSITSLSGEIMANKAFTEMLGYRQDELVGKTWQMLTPPDEVEQIQAKLSALLNSKEDAVRFDKRYIHKDGSTIWADVSTVVRRDSDGNPLHFITTVINITERKRAEEALQQKLEELIRFQRLVVGRELKMIELKKEINELLVQAGQQPKYHISE